MLIGQMNKRIMAQSEARTTGAGGRADVTYPTISVVWSAVKLQHHSPVIHGDKVTYPGEAIFTTHYDEALKDARRIVWENETYIVQSVSDPRADKKYLEIRCVEKA